MVKIWTDIRVRLLLAWSTVVSPVIQNTWFVQKVSGLELKWLFTEWDVFATSLDI